MTTSVRYVQNTSTAVNTNITVNSTGLDAQLVAFDILLVAGVPQSTTANILQWTGAGNIKSIISALIREPNGAIVTPPTNLTRQRLFLDATQKSVSLQVPNDQTPVIPANSTVSLLLIIGNY